MRYKVINLATDKPKLIFTLMLLIVVIAAAFIPQIKIDTDPENMLSEHQADRLFHDEVKQRFKLHDAIVVGMTNEKSIYNVESLQNIHALTTYILSLDGVMQQDLMSLSTVDNISHDDDGTLRFNWMMQTPPTTMEDALSIQSAVKKLPLLDNTLVSADEKAVAIYVPIRAKDESYRIATEINEYISSLSTQDEFYITGLPVAEDTFGVEMFKQMAISAPAAGVVIFFIMWFFFRSFALISAPMIMAVATVVITMGALIGGGYTVHIMSSMIPIFLMPIAVVDSVHVLSEFADRYKPGDDAKELIRNIMKHLFKPMLYTSITSSIGFFSLALTPIPPVQVFGMFIGMGILLAFAFTMTFIPAYVVTLSDEKLKKLTDRVHAHENSSPLSKLLRAAGSFSQKFKGSIIFVSLVLLSISFYGISKIEINDNPIRWFEKTHPIYVADQVLNSHFAGTYNSYIVLEKNDGNDAYATMDNTLSNLLRESSYYAQWQELQSSVSPLQINERYDELAFTLGDWLFDATDNDALAIEQALSIIEKSQADSQYFISPKALESITELQEALLESGYVGKSNALPDLVKTVYRELNGSDDFYRIPEQQSAVAQSIFSFQSSHRPDDLWHMVTPDYQSAVIWLQLTSGDNKDMSQVIRFVDNYIEEHPLPENIELRWAGLTYINVVWQDAMVFGMAESLAGAFIFVLIMMIVLFRSILLGLLAMIPLTITISFIYGMIGFIGKDYDMPIAVLSALTLGLSVDFAIHFIQRAREIKRNDKQEVNIDEMFEEPSRAISRNAIVIALGFTPLLLAPLLPYKTVGLFLASIMAVSCVVTLVLLPAVMTSLQKFIWK